MNYNQPPPPPGAYPPAQAPQPQAPQPQQYPQQPPPPQQQPTPPYWPDNQTPPAYQAGNPQFSNAPQAAGPPTTPVFHAPDPEATAQELDRLDAEAGSRRTGGFAKEIRVPGPNGETKWDANVPIGYEGRVQVYLCGAWAPGVRTAFVEKVNHFVKTYQHPKGLVVVHGEDCEFCKSRAMALEVPSLQKSAQDFGRLNRRTLYNAFDLSNPTTHYGQDGVMRPFILAAGVQLQGDLKRMFDMKGGFAAFANPEAGRPIVITKKKTGPNPMDIEWGAIHEDQGSLHPYFHPGLSNLWDLSKEIAPSSHQAVAAAIQELGWPMPESLVAKLQQAQGQSQAPYSVASQPPHPSPYSQPQAIPPPSASTPSPPQPAPPPVPGSSFGTPAAPGMPPVPPPGSVPHVPPGPSAPPPPAPASVPPVDQFPPPGPAAYPSAAPMPPPGAQAPPQGMPPPPPVTSTGQGLPPQQAAQQAPLPPGAAAPPPPPPGGPAPGGNPAPPFTPPPSGTPPF